MTRSTAHSNRRRRRDPDHASDIRELLNDRVHERAAMHLLGAIQSMVPSSRLRRTYQRLDLTDITGRAVQVHVTERMGRPGVLRIQVTAVRRGTWEATFVLSELEDLEVVRWLARVATDPDRAALPGVSIEAVGTGGVAGAKIWSRAAVACEVVP
jgi:hypothetical protein